MWETEFKLGNKKSKIKKPKSKSTKLREFYIF